MLLGEGFGSERSVLVGGFQSGGHRLAVLLVQGTHSGGGSNGEDGGLQGAADFRSDAVSQFGHHGLHQRFTETLNNFQENNSLKIRRNSYANQLFYYQLLGSGVVSPGLGSVRASLALIEIAAAEQLFHSGEADGRLGQELRVGQHISRRGGLQRREQFLGFRMSLDIPAAQF